MGLVRAVDDDEYVPEYGMLVVRDIEDADYGFFGGVLSEHGTDAHPGGTIAHAGWGWLRGSGSDDEAAVRLEFHDSEPPDDRSNWADVVETPYWSGTGEVRLAFVTGDADGESLLLDGQGHYRVRVSRQDSVWCLRFWAVPEPADGPRWLVRSEPAVPDEPSGWDEVLPFEVMELYLAMAAVHGPVTVEKIVAIGRTWHKPATWLDDLLWPEPLPGLDAEAYAERVEYQAEQRAALADVARQLGVAVPRTLREAFPLLTAAGLITGDAVAGFELVVDPPRARDLLNLSPEALAAMAESHAFQRYTALASDVVSIVAWSSSDAMAIVTAEELAERLLVPVDEVMEALAYADDAGLVKVDPLPNGTLTLVVEPAADFFKVDDDIDTEFQRLMSAEFASDELRPFGAPPRAGVIVDRRLVVWRDGHSVELARFADSPAQALETAYGTVVGGHKTVLVRADGSSSVLGADFGAGMHVSVDGRFLAAGEPQALHLIDLADGMRRTLPWDEQPRVIGLHDGWVYFHAAGRTLRWRPGATPTELPVHLDAIDPTTGTALAANKDGRLVLHPDGTRTHLPIDPTAQLTPGGSALFTCTQDPPTVTFFPLPPAEPTTHWLPEDCTPNPTWEGPHHLLFPSSRQTAYRLDTRDGSIEAVPILEAPYGTVLFVRPN